MKRTILLIALIVSILFAVSYVKQRYYDPWHRSTKAKDEVQKLFVNDVIKNGDIIFQTSLARQSLAIQLATKSKYSHCGIIFKDGDDYSVFEAVQPVKYTPLYKWIARGQDGHYVIKRLKNADQILTSNVFSEISQICGQFKGRSYDLNFEWSDNKMYCSELVWKIYKQATGLEIGKLQKLSDFDLSSEVVKQKMIERYGNNIPMNETVISPAAMFESNLLVTVKENE